MNALVRLLRKCARPYRKGHLLHADGSAYMERFSLFETRCLGARLHHIVTHDYDRVMHDHPWSFVAVMLSGGYAESRPVDPLHPTFSPAGREIDYVTTRFAGSVALRRATDRHRIVSVLPNTWTLFIYGPIRQWWGFFAPQGKVYWKDYPTVHDTTQETAHS